ncbi:MAG: hypothetical protein KME21_05720 [Desmonostoc vinosum HA7617-LM4]|nr:hypothetical protein [Desmonostoc vinosum HA7617-LM4]
MFDGEISQIIRFFLTQNQSTLGLTKNLRSRLAIVEAVLNATALFRRRFLKMLAWRNVS